MWYDPGWPKRAQEVLERQAITKLTEDFKMNIDDENAQNFYYRDFSEQFVWVASLKIWKPRERINLQKPETIGRLVSIYPNQEKSYF